jgi:hypothetical protein
MHDRRSLARSALVVLTAAGGVLGAMQCVLPRERFLHRVDDAFYYFDLARNFDAHGFWTLDGVHATNGVQPLWALLLTLLFSALRRVGVGDSVTLARAAVGLAAILHVGSGVLLFRLLERRISLVAAVGAVGALLLPLGIVWNRTGGLENALYAFLLSATIAHAAGAWRSSPRLRASALLGVLLGVTTLARLNAALLGVALALVHLWDWRAEPKRGARDIGVVGVVALLVVAPYLIFNIATTGHLLPLSGAAKALGVKQTIAIEGAGSLVSWPHAVYVLAQATRLRYFLCSRLADGLWPLGTRLAFPGDGAPFWQLVLPLLLILAALGYGGRHAGPWRALAVHGRGLRPLYLFAVMNLAVSLVLYPNDVWYAMSRWWLVELEIALAILVGVLLAGAAARWQTWLRRLPPVLVLAALAAHGMFQVSWAGWYFWLQRELRYDWEPPTSPVADAATWISSHVAPDVRLGAWNAGLLAFLVPNPVENLDGLVNDAAFLDVLAGGTLAAYIESRCIRYLVDDRAFVETRRGLVPLASAGRKFPRERWIDVTAEWAQADHAIFRVVAPCHERSAPSVAQPEVRPHPALLVILCEAQARDDGMDGDRGGPDRALLGLSWYGESHAISDVATVWSAPFVGGIPCAPQPSQQRARPALRLSPRVSSAGRDGAQVIPLG